MPSTGLQAADRLKSEHGNEAIDRAADERRIIGESKSFDNDDPE
jgi:hypothetical protein